MMNHKKPPPDDMGNLQGRLMETRRHMKSYVTSLCKEGVNPSSARSKGKSRFSEKIQSLEESIANLRKPTRKSSAKTKKVVKSKTPKSEPKSVDEEFVDFLDFIQS